MTRASDAAYDARGWARLHDEAKGFASTAFDNGHYPNPVGHDFVGCSICRSAKAAADLVDYLAIVRDTYCENGGQDEVAGWPEVAVRAPLASDEHAEALPGGVSAGVGLPGLPEENGAKSHESTDHLSTAGRGCDEPVHGDAAPVARSAAYAPHQAQVTFRIVPDVSPGGFLRNCYDEWVKDAAYYRAHPELDCPSEYLDISPFEEFVAEIAEARLAEMKAMFTTDDGFTVEVVPDD